MLKTTEAFENGDAAECYEHFAMMVDPARYFTLPRTLLNAIAEIAVTNPVRDFISKGNAYLLYGHALMTCSDPYDMIVPIAVSDSREELMVFADLHEMQVEEK